MLRGIFEPLSIGADLERRSEIKCLENANKSASVKSIDDKTLDLARNWNPTGFYSPEQIRLIVAEVLKGNTAARAALAFVPLSTSDAAQQIRQAHTYLNRNEERAKTYLDAAARNPDVVDAPGLKTWVLNSMVNISQAYVTVAALSCRVTWLDNAANAITGIWSIAKRVVGIVIRAGDTVLKAAEDVWGLYPILKWGALGVGLLLGGIFVAGHVQRFRQKHLPGQMYGRYSRSR